ncbi:hypothetical protein HHI36_013817 [Cryptolaemus montrouzieri]|uniref:Uncharacterized protein n=1 Tax=Cryptolaemus montrouzieri TaxID=559131 RepID=A0ABD2NII6_9CUCU
MVNCIMNQYDKISPDTEISRNLKLAVLAELKKRFGKIEKVTIIALATLLDPRFKNIHFTDPQAAAHAIMALRGSLRDNEQISDNASSSSSDNAENPEHDFWSYHKVLAHKP